MSNAARDVFLSHASEDKEQFVRPFAAELDRRGITYWLDEAEIKWGDKITQKINDGLRTSRYVIVFLSDDFLGKNWPQSELSTALSKENSDGQTVVLPLMLADSVTVLNRYPLLRDKAYLKWSNSISTIVDQLERMLGGRKTAGSYDSTQVPPLKLPTGLPLPEQMHGAFVDVWRSLSALQQAGNELWRHVSDSTLGSFADSLRDAEELVAHHALFFSDDEYHALAEVLRAANFYFGGKERLLDIRKGIMERERQGFIMMINLARPGERDVVVDEKIRRQIDQNKRWLGRYANLLKEIRSRFHRVVVK